MSYDLMVFDPAAAPRERKEFMRWYDELTQWGEDHSYDDAAVTTPRLRSWYDAMRQTWTPMNGPDAPDRSQWPPDSPNWDDESPTGYSIGKHAIYCTFRWPCAKNAYADTVRLAREHRVGFFDVSATNGDIVFPIDEGEA